MDDGEPEAALNGRAVMGEDWYRNTSWDEAVAEQFEARLRRARRKQHYLRIQAGILAPGYPEAALALLDRYFAGPGDLEHALAHVHRAQALRSLGRLEEAAEAYEAALAREAEFPNVQAGAAMGLASLIAEEALEARYGQALLLLEACRKALNFPVEEFRWHAASALIAAGEGRRMAARSHAVRALAAARQRHSGFPRHPAAGLVMETETPVMRRLEDLARD